MSVPAGIVSIVNNPGFAQELFEREVAHRKRLAYRKTDQYRRDVEAYNQREEVARVQQRIWKDWSTFPNSSNVPPYNPKRQRTEMDFTGMDHTGFSGGGERPAIPRQVHAKQLGKKRYKRKVRSKFYRKVYSIAHAALDEQFPLSVHVGGGDTDPVNYGQSGNYWSIIDVGQHGQAPPAANSPAIIDSYIYDSTVFGVSPPTAGTYPKAVPFDYIINGGNTNALAVPELTHTWAQFIGINGMTAINNKEWFELKYEKMNFAMAVPAQLPSFRCCIYYLLLPAQYGDVVTTTGGKAMRSFSYSRMVDMMAQCFGVNFLDKNLPQRFAPQKFDMKIMKKFCINMRRPSSNMNALVTAGAESAPTQFLVNTTQNRFFKKYAFKYGSTGLRFYATNTASAYIPWVAAGQWTFFLGSDRTTPVVPVRVQEFSTVPGIPGNLSEAIFKAPWYYVTSTAQSFTWFNIQNTGQFAGLASDDPAAV